MYLELIKQQMIELAARLTEQVNGQAETDYLAAARDWATNKARGVNVPAPAVPFVVIFERTEANGVEPRQTETPVSNIKPESFLPTYGTDTNAVGGPVGGPIPGQEGLYYASAGANPQPGDVVMMTGGTFVYQRPTPFGGYWRKIA